MPVCVLGSRICLGFDVGEALDFVVWEVKMSHLQPNDAGGRE